MGSDVIVIDCGSGFVCAGLATDSEPRVNIPSVYQGKRPIVRGAVQDWSAWAGLLGQTFAALGIDPAGKSVLLTESPFIPKPDRERAIQILFDNFGAGGMYMATGEFLALYAMGLTTGLVIMSGYGLTHTAPVYQYYLQRYAIMPLDLAGSDLDTRMQSVLAAEGTTVDLDTARAMKENLGYVALDFEAAIQSGGQGPGTYQGRTANKARFLTPEALFKPDLAGVNQVGIHHGAHDAIMKCDTDMRGGIGANIIVAGGSTRFPGLVERLAMEMRSLMPANIKTPVITLAPSQAAWKGGAKFTGMDGFQSMWVTRQEYQTKGAKIVHIKCP